ncbi:MAG: TlpA disulfide reductase family protein [Thermomicrobiales bacterium]
MASSSTPPDDPSITDPDRAVQGHDLPDAAPVAAPDPFAEDEQPDREASEHGRIGYSRFGRLSSIGLAALIVLALVAVGIVNRVGSSNDTPDDDTSAVPTAGVQADRPAPDFSLTLFDGSTFSLADQRGKIVVMNFWASWCGPCKEEMPVLQAAASSAPADVVFVGIGAKTDKEDDARQFASDHGVTYAIGRDTGGDDKVRGSIEQDYRIPGYPATFVIDADGNIVSIKMGEISPEELEQAIALARG